MATEGKTPIHKHAHPAYAWIALIVCVTVILGLSGWYYLTLSDGYNNDLVYSSQELATPTKETSSATNASPVDVSTEVQAIDDEINGISESDFSDTQLDNTILGIQ